MLNEIYQTETWKSKDGRVWRLDEMTPEHRENTIKWIHRYLPDLRQLLGFQAALAASTMTGEMALDLMDGEIQFFDEASDEELLDSFPLVRRMRELNYVPPRPLTSVTNPVLAAYRDSQLPVEMWISSLDAAQAFGGYTAWDRVGHPFHSMTIATREQLEHAEKVLCRLNELRGGA